MLGKHSPWCAGRALLIGAVLAWSAPSAMAAAASWKGQTQEAKISSDAEVKLSIMGYSEPDKAKAVVTHHQQYLANHNVEEFEKFLQQQETEGYLFTNEAVGYSVKYVWKSEDKLNKRMVLLVWPALLTRNPYLWKHQYQRAQPFTVVEVKLAGDEAVLTTSLDMPVEVNAQGQLQLHDTGKGSVFARLKDDTPYYLKN